MFKMTCHGIFHGRFRNVVEGVTVVKHLTSSIRFRGRRVASGPKLAACMTSLFVALGATASLAQYGPSPYQQAASPYGHPGTVNRLPAVNQPSATAQYPQAQIPQAQYPQANQQGYRQPMLQQSSYGHSDYGHQGYGQQNQNQLGYRQPQGYGQPQGYAQQPSYGQSAYAQANGRPNGYGQAVAQTQPGHGSLFQRGASFFDPRANAPETLPPPVEPQLQLPSQMQQHAPPAAGQGAAANQRPSVSDQLWADGQNGYGYGNGEGYGGSCGAGGCAPCDIGCAPCAAPCWYVGLTGLYMTRDLNNIPRTWTTADGIVQAMQLTNTNSTFTDGGNNGSGGGDLWQEGAEVTFGYCLPCWCKWSIQGSYWQMDEWNGYASTTSPMSVSTPLAINDIEFAGVNASTFFDGADEHRLWRDFEFRNLELNMVYHPVRPCGGMGRWNVTGLVGVRYMKFDDHILFGSLASGGDWAVPTDQAYLEDSISNDLFGIQVGANVQRHLWKRLSFNFTPKIGILNNHVENRFHAYRGDGLAANPTAASGVTGSYPVDGETNQLSFLMEANFGLSYHIGCRWELTAGYRFLAMTGMGLVENQIPQYIVDIPEIADLDTTGYVLLHGGYAGVTYRF